MGTDLLPKTEVKDLYSQYLVCVMKLKQQQLNAPYEKSKKKETSNSQKYN